MQPLLRNRLITIGFFALVALGLGLVGYFGLSQQLRERKNAPAASATPTENTVIELVSCEGQSQPICILSTGFDAEGNLLISLRIKLSPVPALVARVTQKGVETLFNCQPVELSPGMVYCLGPYTDQNLAATVKIYTKTDAQLLALGTLKAGGLALVSPATAPPAATEAQITETPFEIPTEIAVTPSEPIVAPTELITAYPNTSYPTYP